MKPTDEQIRICIEVYHRYSDKGVTVDMIKEARNNSGLQMFQAKEILENYVKTTYSVINPE